MQRPAENGKGQLKNGAVRMELLGAVTHALKGLLNGMNGGLYLTESGAGQGDTGRLGAGLAMLRRNSRMAGNLVSHFLYYLKDRPSSAEEFPLLPLLEEAVEASLWRGEIRSHGPGGTPWLVESDRNALKALFVNLLDFVAEDGTSSQPQSGEQSIVVGMNAESAWAAIPVTASGLGQEGIGEVLSNSFSPKGVERKRLLLNMAWLLAEKLGGSIAFEGEGDPGARFRVNIPMKKLGMGGKL